jgi:hypothetical protein
MYFGETCGKYIGRLQLTFLASYFITDMFQNLQTEMLINSPTMWSTLMVCNTLIIRENNQHQCNFISHLVCFSKSQQKWGFPLYWLLAYLSFRIIIIGPSFIIYYTCKLKVEAWWKKALDRHLWGRIIKKAKVHKGLQSQMKKLYM